MSLGVLYLVATPIGNQRDLSERAIATLRSVDLIAAEDTRHSAVLLRHHGIEKPLLALHEHNEDQRAAALLERIMEGISVALISDAGTPLLSDPGYPLVDLAHTMGIRVIPIPGASALLAALCASGLPMDRFAFEGFLPAKASARLRKLEQLKHETRTLIFFEAPGRIGDCVHDLGLVFGPTRTICVARELTKLHEQIRRASIECIDAELQAGSIPARGEFVLVVQGAEAVVAPVDDAKRLMQLLCTELSPSRAAALAHRMTGLPRRELYELGRTIPAFAGQETEKGNP